MTEITKVTTGKVNVPWEMRKKNLITSITHGTFSYATSKATHVPPGVKYIGKFAYAWCPDIVCLDLSDVKSIDKGGFSWCVGLTTLVLSSECEVKEGAFEGCANLVRVLAPDALVNGDMADPAKVFAGCPVLTGAGLTPSSSVPLPLHRFWHPTMHAFCTPGQRACVLAVLFAEWFSDHQKEEEGVLPVLAHDLWLRILEFVPRRELGRP